MSVDTRERLVREAQGRLYRLLREEGPTPSTEVLERCTYGRVRPEDVSFALVDSANGGQVTVDSKLCVHLEDVPEG